LTRKSTLTAFSATVTPPTGTNLAKLDL